MEKYQKVTKQDYEKWYRANGEYRDRVKKDKDRLSYHLMPETGWLNDPNGLCQFNGTYHIYYQYTPFEPTGEIKLWGHYTTKDFVRYEDEGPALFPDSSLDAHGVYSGSAFIENGTIHYFYTGNIKYFDKTDYDYIMNGRGSNTIHFTSQDGYHFTEKELLLKTSDYPSDMSCHVRDPKIFKEGNFYYMVLGAREQDDRGLVLCYRSADLKTWDYHGRITTKDKFGYMWECPDLFRLDGELVLVCCPQGVEKQGVDYENVHQCTAMYLKQNSENGQFLIDETRGIHLVDRGFDFYAPQSFEDEKGRRILIGWMGIPDADYTNPAKESGWQHALTIPRKLHIKDGVFVQTPIEELKALRQGKRDYQTKEALDAANESGLVFEVEVSFEQCETMTMNLRDGVTLHYGDGLLTLEIKCGGFGRTKRSVRLSDLKSLRIFSDTTSLELFVNGGEEVFTTRVYSANGKFTVSGNCRAAVTVYNLSAFEIHKKDKCLCAIGEALIDFIPEEKGKRLKDVVSFKRAAGGAPSNVAGAVSRLGIPSKMLTKVGDDPFGDYIVETFAAAGINTEYILRDKEGETPLAFVSLSDDGNRDFKFYRKNSADLHYTPEDIPKGILDDCGILHFCSIDLVDSPMKEAHRKLIKQAAAGNVLISFDPNLRLSLWNDDEKLRTTVREFLPMADLVKISDEELLFITGETEIEKALPQLLNGRTECVIYTQGKEGASVYRRESKVSRPGFSVKVRDTTGAGDSFIGAFLFKLLEEKVMDLKAVTEEKLADYLDFANAYAAHTTTMEGALTAMASAKEMAEWMKKLAEQ